MEKLEQQKCCRSIDRSKLILGDKGDGQVPRRLSQTSADRESHLGLVEASLTHTGFIDEVFHGEKLGFTHLC